MNQITAVIIAVAAVIFIGGFIFYGMGNNNPSPTNTTSTTTTTTDTNQAPQPSVPTVTTNSSVTSFDTAAGVSGVVNPEGPATTYWFEYGTTPNFGSSIQKQLVGSGYESITTPGYITGLMKNTTYYFHLVAENSYGTQSGATYSFQTTAGTPPPVGSVPTTKTLSASGITQTTANLAGEVNPNKASTQIWFEYGKTPDLGFGTALQSVGNGSSVVPTSAALASLDPGTTYYYRLNAQNQFGTTNGAVLNFKTAGPAATVAVPVVTTQLANPIATTTATVRGTVNPYNSQTTYWFEYSTDSAFGAAVLKSTPHRSAGGGASTVSVEASITGLKANTAYYYRTVAQNAGGTVRGDSQSLTTK